MNSSGLIYAVIVALWASYLVPMWLRRQDELAGTGSPDRLYTAMRVLSRRTPGAGNGSGTQPDTGPDTGPDAGADTGIPAEPAVYAEVPAEVVLPRSALLAARRRVVSVLFLAFTAGAVLVAVAGTSWVWLPATSGVLLSLYIRRLRIQERRRRAVLRQRRRSAYAAAPGIPGSSRTATDPASRGQEPAHAVATAPTVGSDPTTQPQPGGWQPVPVPLPTYVTAPVSSDERSWTTAEDARAGSAAPGAPVRNRRTEVFDQYQDEFRPRAVND